MHLNDTSFLQINRQTHTHTHTPHTQQSSRDDIDIFNCVEIIYLYTQGPSIEYVPIPLTQLCLQAAGNAV